MRSLFPYIDFQYSTSTFTSQWTRFHFNKVDDLLKEHRGQTCFTSIQLFKSDRHAEHEIQYCPIYFDLDSEGDVEVALKDARDLVDYFSRMEIGQEHIRVWFSGSKGVHVVITPELFDIKPSEELTYVIKNACYYVAHQLNLKSFDSRVYSIRRLWRLPGSVHLKTGLFCTEISHRELGLSVAEIKEIAKGVHIKGDLYVARDPLWDDVTYENLEQIPVCKNWFAAFLEEYETQKELQDLRPKNPIKVIAGENPVCINDLLANSIRKSGTRNQAEMALVSYYKDTGVDESTTLILTNEWARNIPKGFTSKTDKKALEADVKGVVKTVFDKDHGDRYHFACHFIRALGTGTEKPIACLHEKCKFINNPDDQEPEKAISLKLSQTTRSVYINKRIQTQLMVAGKDDAPYGVPVKVQIRCKPDMTRENSMCKVCPLAQFGGTYEHQFSAKKPQILRLIETTDVVQKQFIRHSCGIPDKCPRHTVKVLEYVNIIELMTIPRIDFRPDNITDEEQYVTRKCYFVGHDIETNREYTVSGYPYPDPKSQHVVIVIDDAKSLQDDVMEFKPTLEVLESLKIFQIKGNDEAIEVHAHAGRNKGAQVAAV